MGATKSVLVVIGIAFTVMITSEVASRFIFDYSISQANALAQIMLVWFFLLGGSLAMRQGGHVGLDILVNALSGRSRTVVLVFSNLLVLIFFLEIIYGAVLALSSSWSQFDGTLGISMAWVMAAYPVGFTLFIYHQAVTLYQALNAPAAAEGRR